MTRSGRSDHSGDHGEDRCAGVEAAGVRMRREVSRVLWRRNGAQSRNGTNRFRVCMYLEYRRTERLKEGALLDAHAICVTAAAETKGGGDARPIAQREPNPGEHHHARRVRRMADVRIRPLSITCCCSTVCTFPVK